MFRLYLKALFMNAQTDSVDGMSGYITTQSSFFVKKWGGKMAKIEENFLVMNLKHLEKIPAYPLKWFKAILEEVARYLPVNKYYVCNQDEPYAEEVINIILRGEDEKNLSS